MNWVFLLHFTTWSDFKQPRSLLAQQQKWIIRALISCSWSFRVELNLSVRWFMKINVLTVYMSIHLSEHWGENPRKCCWIVDVNCRKSSLQTAVKFMWPVGGALMQCFKAGEACGNWSSAESGWDKWGLEGRQAGRQGKDPAAVDMDVSPSEDPPSADYFIFFYV